MSRIRFSHLPFLIFIFVLGSCRKEEPNAWPGLFTHGVVICNEGAFQNNNGSVSYYDLSQNKVFNNVFEVVNKRPLGDVVQSFSASAGKGFIVVNNSQKVEVIDLTDFSSIGAIPASYPRFLLPLGSDKAYLTNGSYPGEVLVINTHKLEVTDTIPVGNQPENLILSGSKVFVANGKWGNDNTVSVIDTFTNKVVQTIDVGDGPTDLVADSDGNVWVLCQGKVIYNEDWTQIIEETDSRLVRINAQSMEVDRTFVVGQMGDYFNPYILTAGNNGASLYYQEAGGLYKFNIQDSSLPAVPLIATSFNGVEIDPQTGNIFGLESKGYTSSGALHIYDANGIMKSTFNVGIAPNGAVFY